MSKLQPEPNALASPLPVLRLNIRGGVKVVDVAGKDSKTTTQGSPVQLTKTQKPSDAASASRPLAFGRSNSKTGEAKLVSGTSRSQNDPNPPVIQSQLKLNLQKKKSPSPTRGVLADLPVDEPTFESGYGTTSRVRPVSITKDSDPDPEPEPEPIHTAPRQVIVAKRTTTRITTRRVADRPNYNAADSGESDLDRKYNDLKEYAATLERMVGRREGERKDSFRKKMEQQPNLVEVATNDQGRYQRVPAQSYTSEERGLVTSVLHDDEIQPLDFEPEVSAPRQSYRVTSSRQASPNTSVVATPRGGADDSPYRGAPVTASAITSASLPTGRPPLATQKPPQPSPGRGGAPQQHSIPQSTPVSAQNLTTVITNAAAINRYHNKSSRTTETVEEQERTPPRKGQSEAIYSDPNLFDEEDDSKPALDPEPPMNAPQFVQQYRIEGRGSQPRLRGPSGREASNASGMMGTTAFTPIKEGGAGTPSSTHSTSNGVTSSAATASEVLQGPMHALHPQQMMPHIVYYVPVQGGMPNYPHAHQPFVVPQYSALPPNGSTYSSYGPSIVMPNGTDSPSTSALFGQPPSNLQQFYQQQHGLAQPLHHRPVPSGIVPADFHPQVPSYVVDPVTGSVLTRTNSLSDHRHHQNQSSNPIIMHTGGPQHNPFTYQQPPSAVPSAGESVSEQDEVPPLYVDTSRGDQGRRPSEMITSPFASTAAPTPTIAAKSIRGFPSDVMLTDIPTQQPATRSLSPPAKRQVGEEDGDVHTVTTTTTTTVAKKNTKRHYESGRLPIPEPERQPRDEYQTYSRFAEGATSAASGSGRRRVAARATSAPKVVYVDGAQGYGRVQSPRPTAPKVAAPIIASSRKAAPLPPSATNAAQRNRIIQPAAGGSQARPVTRGDDQQANGVENDTLGTRRVRSVSAGSNRSHTPINYAVHSRAFVVPLKVHHKQEPSMY